MSSVIHFTPIASYIISSFYSEYLLQAKFQGNTFAASSSKSNLEEG